MLFALLLPSAWATTALAQQPHVSGTADAALLTAASIQRIRAALEHPPAITLASVDRAAQFRVVIREPQRFRERPPLDFSAGAQSGRRHSDLRDVAGDALNLIHPRP